MESASALYFMCHFAVKHALTVHVIHLQETQQDCMIGSRGGAGDKFAWMLSAADSDGTKSLARLPSLASCFQHPLCLGMILPPLWPPLLVAQPLMRLYPLCLDALFNACAPRPSCPFSLASIPMCLRPLCSHPLVLSCNATFPVCPHPL